MKLGLRLPDHDERDMRLGAYLDHTTLPDPPAVFGHGELVAESEWGMLSNDRVGDCVWAGAGHETMVLGREGEHNPTFDDTCVLADYSAVTGWNPRDPESDQGTDPRVAAKYRATTGIQDVHGRRHKIGAYLWLKPGDLEQLWHAMYIFGVAGVCYELPATAQQQFAEGKPWDYVPGAPIEGGHYVPACGRRSGGFLDAVSWGQRIAITPRFYEQYCRAALVYVSAAALGSDGLTPEGFDRATLVADLAALRGGALFSAPEAAANRPLNPLADAAAA
jgi:hypothetical protein